MKTFYRLRSFFPAVFWAILIFLGSSFAGREVSKLDWLDFLVHKAIHIFEYAVLAILVLRGIRGLKGARGGSLSEIRWVLAFCFLFGLSDEYHQSFVPGREAKLRDALIDLLGGSLGVLVGWQLPPPAWKKLSRLAKSLLKT